MPIRRTFGAVCCAQHRDSYGIRQEQWLRAPTVPTPACLWRAVYEIVVKAGGWRHASGEPVLLCIVSGVRRVVHLNEQSGQLERAVFLFASRWSAGQPLLRALAWSNPPCAGARRSEA